MWKYSPKILSPLLFQTEFLLPENKIQQQIRTTFILKRRNSPFLHKKGALPKRLRNKHFIYDLAADTNVTKQPNIDVILTKYIEGLGIEGEKVSVRPNYAYNNLLLPGLAVYATPENIEKYKEYEAVKQTVQHSSPTAQRMINILSRLTLSVVMNKETPWTLKPWHVKASFRKCGFYVPEETIKIPSQPIEGPNLNLENKNFFVTVTVNKAEKVQVCCRIHHWSTSVVDRLPYKFEFWKEPTEPIFQENTNANSEIK